MEEMLQLEEEVCRFFRNEGYVPNEVKVEGEDIKILMDLGYFYEEELGLSTNEKIDYFITDIIDYLREVPVVFDCLDSYEIFYNGEGDSEVEVTISVMLED